MVKSVNCVNSRLGEKEVDEVKFKIGLKGSVCINVISFEDCVVVESNDVDFVYLLGNYYDFWCLGCVMNVRNGEEFDKVSEDVVFGI